MTSSLFILIQTQIALIILRHEILTIFFCSMTSRAMESSTYKVAMNATGSKVCAVDVPSCSSDSLFSGLETQLCEWICRLSEWQSSKQPGLTRETFLALKQTCLALRDCAIHLLEQCGFNYVLLVHLQSDAIDRRFRWLRLFVCLLLNGTSALFRPLVPSQLSGANYFIISFQCDKF